MSRGGNSRLDPRLVVFIRWEEMKEGVGFYFKRFTGYAYLARLTAKFVKLLISGNSNNSNPVTVKPFHLFVCYSSTLTSSLHLR